LGAFFTYLWQKRQQRDLRETELKEKRYLCILLLMYAHLNPKEFGKVMGLRPDIRTPTDLLQELKTEWVNSWIYADDCTIAAFKEFLESPGEKSFAEVILAMRKELWGKKTHLPLSTFSLKSV